MIHANAQLEVDLVFASIFCLSLMGVGLYGFVEVLERACIPWSWEGQKKGEASS
jgi:ABC-type nitrate/sulfonate/bicarbonate transport system permease component